MLTRRFILRFYLKMSRKTAKACVPVKSTVSLPLKEKPYVHGIFLDAAQTSYDLPLCNVPEVKDPKNVDPNGVYDVFYSEYIAPGTKHRETYPECKKRISYIPKFEAGSDEKGPGLFPATILLTGGIFWPKYLFAVLFPDYN